MNQTSASPLPKRLWRHFLLLAIAVGSLALVFLFPPITQDSDYHNFADTRTFVGIPNAINVFSNLPFMLVGIAGIVICAKMPERQGRGSWLSFFIGVTCVSIGSMYYHWAPRNETLFWDRAPMAMAFMGLVVAFLSEFVNPRASRFLLPALLLGLGSVLYWRMSGDLRLYVWVQFIAFVAIPLVMILFRSRYSHRWLFLSAAAFYFLAKVFEMLDKQVFTFTGRMISGHSLKHLAAAFGCFAILRMLKKRKPLAGLD